MNTERIVLLPDWEAVFSDSCPVGWTFAYQASLWTVKGLYLARARTGAREVCLIVREEISAEFA